MKNKILITGGSGQVGKNLYNILIKEYEILKPTRKQLDFLVPDKLTKYLNENKPDFIVNCAAYTNVDKAEIDKENCSKINIDSVKAICKYSKKNNRSFIHLSSDYVFGNKNNKIPWKEYDQTNPLNFYGLSKLESEKIITSNSSNGIIIRSSGIYSNEKNNFLDTMIKLSSLQSDIKVVENQINSPTPAWWLASAIKSIISLKINNLLDSKMRILHASTEGQVSWHQFSIEIFKILKSRNLIKQLIKPLKISSEEYNSITKRPNFSALDNSRIKSLGIDTITWKEGLNKTINIRKKLKIEN